MPPIEFKDQMYELLQDAEMETEYQEMIPAQKELASQLMPRENAEYREMKEYYQLQGSESE